MVFSLRSSAISRTAGAIPCAEKITQLPGGASSTSSIKITPRFLKSSTARIKARTDHLKGVKIAIMGCIVNGPGEMADADFGYVGGAPGKINLYVGKTPIKFNIPEAEAVERLVDLIREHGKWVDPEPAAEAQHAVA